MFSHYLDEKLESVNKCGLASIERTDIGNNSAVSRVSLTIALSLHYVGAVQAAREWYTRCRLAAVYDGDEATLAALMHSMAWMRISAGRIKGIEGEDAAQGDLVLVKSETVASYESLVGATNLPVLTPLLRAQECVLEERYMEAIDLVNLHYSEIGQSGYERLGPGLLADHAFCLSRLGRTDEAEALAMQARQRNFDILHSDDLVIVHTMLQRTFQELKIGPLAEQHGVEALRARQKLTSFRCEMAKVIEDLVKIASENKAYDSI